MLQVVSSTSAAARLQAVFAFLERFPPSTEILVVGASRGAADDLARQVARRHGATFGLVRFGLIELAARAAAAAGAPERVPGTQAVAEAMAARAAFEARKAGALEYFGPVSHMPGFSRALARTIQELRLAGIESGSVGGPAVTDRHPASVDLAQLLARVEGERGEARIDDRAALLRSAIEAWTRGLPRWCHRPLVILDVPIDARLEREFVAALVEGAPDALATLPDGDRRAMEAFAAMGATVDVRTDAAPPQSDLSHLRRFVFTRAQPPERSTAGDVRVFSAPGEGREAVEIVRRVLDEASAGVPFDEMAVLLRAPQQYLGLLEHAAARGGVPAYFDRGMRRPDPAGRAFVALLSCAVEGLSAKRFDEYLSLGQVPRVDQADASARVETSVAPRDDVFGVPPPDASVDDPDTATPDAPSVDTDEQAVVAGSLRAPWKWEELIVESAVVGGRTRKEGKARWRRRLDGLREDMQVRLAELARDEPDASRVTRLQRDLVNLRHLREFALPIVDVLADWPDQGSWGDWIARCSALARQALVRPDRIVRALADLAPMAAVGPVALEEVRDVLHERLVTLDWDPPGRRYGRVFVGTPHQARGRTFRVVFVPGLAERIVPQRPREDPLLLDERRPALDADLLRQDDRGAAERLLLKVAIGAASERLYLSYPRMDVAETRARVPSFYALDVVRAMTGRVPDHRALAADAADEAGANLAWPAPADPARAIDDLEHDLAVLKPLIDSRDPASVKGRAHYLLGLNDALRRSVIARWARGRPAWSASDGLVRVSPGIAPVIARSRLGARPYSLSALQRFAACPYQFLLGAIHRLEPWEEPEPLVRMDPLTRGSLFHRVQAEFLRAMAAAGRLPLGPSAVEEAVATLDQVLTDVAAEYEERLAPAIARVWQDEVGDMRRDLAIWVRKMADDQDWIPRFFEFSFGLSDDGRDPRSLPEPVRVEGGFLLRGSVDVIEQHRERDELRVTDHKTGRNRSKPDMVVGGGAVLQPVLYSVAVEEGLGRKVAEGRLYFCTTAGGFAVQPFPITELTRRQGLQVLAIVDRAVEQGFLPAAPHERACTWCDFRPVCGPREEERVGRKNRDRLADLEALRSMR